VSLSVLMFVQSSDVWYSIVLAFAHVCLDVDVGHMFARFLRVLVLTVVVVLAANTCGIGERCVIVVVSLGGRVFGLHFADCLIRTRSACCQACRHV